MFYVTYGYGSNLRNKYSKVAAPDYGSAHDLAHEVTSGKFAFMYDEDDFLPQIEKYGLHEVALQPQGFPE